MAITKTGIAWLTPVLHGAKVLGNMALRHAFPAVTTALAANDIASGQRSVGEAIGDAAGSVAGYYGTNALMKRLTRNRKIPYVGGALNFVIPTAASIIGADKGSEILGKVAPWRRKPISSVEYLENRGPDGTITPSQQ